MNKKPKNHDFSGSDETGSDRLAQVRHFPAAKHPQSGIASSKTRTQTSTTKSLDEEALIKEFDDGYDSDLIGDAMDRRRLQNMTEKEREQEFYNRLERRETLQKRFEIDKKLRLRKQQRKEEKHQQKKKKPNTSIATFPYILPDPSNRRGVTRKKKRSGALDNSKAERQRMGNKAKKQKLQVSDVYSDDEDDEMMMSRSRSGFIVSCCSDTGFDEEVARTSDKDGRANNVKRQPLLIKDKLSTIRLSRFRLENWIHLPFFKETVLGCYVRVAIGEEEGRPVYLIAEIIDVVETTTTYQLGKTRTNLNFRLKHGQHKRFINLKYISNSYITDSEFFKWKQAMEEAGERLPSLDDIAKKQVAINKAQSYKIIDSDIDRIVKEKSRSRKPKFDFQTKKIDLLMQQKMARSRGDTDEVNRLTKLLDELIGRPIDLHNKTQKHKLAVSYKHKGIKSDNLRQMKACKEEWRTLQNNEADPCNRKRCKPFVVCNTGDRKQMHNLLRKIDKRYGISSTESNFEPEISKIPIAAIQAKNVLEFFYYVHDFELNIDLKMLSADVKIEALKINPTSIVSNTPRRSFNMAEYKKRWNLI
ncbi:unnamed protein product [Clavelina lepadiformis]|uniref:Plus3 domain-containing protein n=1 Tax=Clavelina lepadiformis TaxID=159417 RepID=A0ABP0FJQ8_CLALP